MFCKHRNDDTYSSLGIGLILLVLATALGLLRATGLLVS
jgi:hypothetical protein